MLFVLWLCVLGFRRTRRKYKMADESISADYDLRGTIGYLSQFWMAIIVGYGAIPTLLENCT